MKNRQKIIKKAVLDLKELISFLEIDAKNLKKILPSPSYPIKIPYCLVKKMAKNDLSDPLFLQFVTLKKEKKQKISKLNKNFKKDPLCDSSFLKGSLLHKYKNRALILCSHNCAMHCRFCFRQNLHYQSAINNFSFELEQIQKNKNLSEIILSGGDPLSLSNKALKKLLFSLKKIEHVKRIRIHSRFLIGFPERIDAKILEIFAKLKKPLYFVLHINHPKELKNEDNDDDDSEILKAFKKLKKSGVILMNQAVLLKGVNDNLETLLELSEALANQGILFYYLHQLDQVQGASHFEVEKEKGLELIRQLQKKTSGYAVPKYVQEIPFEKSKTLLTCP